MDRRCDKIPGIRADSGIPGRQHEPWRAGETAAPVKFSGNACGPASGWGEAGPDDPTLAGVNHRVDSGFPALIGIRYHHGGRGVVLDTLRRGVVFPKDARQYSGSRRRTAVDQR